jgi:hypothetical protein
VWFETQVSYFDQSFMLTREFGRFPDGVVQVCRKHNNRTWLFLSLQLEWVPADSERMISLRHGCGPSPYEFITYRVISCREKCFILESVEIMEVMVQLSPPNR